MSDTTVTKINRKSTAEYKVIFEQLMSEVTQIEEKMIVDRTIIERLKTETQILKAESDLIKAQTQERLDALISAS